MRRTEIDVDMLFGKDRGQEDVNLSKYFIRTNQFNQIHSGSKELVLGRKGSGKSSLFSYLNDTLPAENVIPITISPTGEDFVRLERKLNEYEGLSLNDEYKYSLAWYELILTEIAFSVISEKHKVFLHGADEKLYKYLKKNEKLKGDFVSQFANSILRAFSGGKIKLPGTELDFDFSDITVLGSPEENEIQQALKKVVTSNNFFVLVDNLDEPWKNTPQMNSWLRGLILAERRIKRDFNNLKMVVFLRDDIYTEIVKGSDIFDSRSEILTLNWKDEKNYSLRKLLAARIAAYFNEATPSEEEDIDRYFEMIYPFTIFRNGNHQKTFHMVAERTFYKPRDFLQFFRNALESAISDNLPVTQRAIESAEREYSSWKISFIQGEYAKTYSGINECIDTFAGITDNWRFSYNSILKHLNTIPEEYRIRNLAEERILSSKETLDFLYLIGFLRKVLTVGKYKKRKFITYLEEPTPSSPSG